MKNIFALSLFLISSIFLFGQELQLLDSETNEPIAFATIIASDQMLLSNQNGQFDNSKLLNSTDIITIQYLGYEDLILSAEELINLELILMDRSSFLLPTIEIVGLKNSIKCNYTVCCCSFINCQLNNVSIPVEDKKSSSINTSSEELAFSAFPNPFVNQIYIQFKNEKALNGSLRIISSLGNIIREEKIQVEQENYMYSISQLDHLTAGNYYFQYIDGEKIISKKLIRLDMN